MYPYERGQPPDSFDVRKEFNVHHPGKMQTQYYLGSSFNLPSMVAVYASLATSSLEQAVLFVTSVIDELDDEFTAENANKMRHPYIPYTPRKEGGNGAK